MDGGQQRCGLTRDSRGDATEQNQKATFNVDTDTQHNLSAGGHQGNADKTGKSVAD